MKLLELPPRPPIILSLAYCPKISIYKKPVNVAACLSIHVIGCNPLNLAVPVGECPPSTYL